MIEAKETLIGKISAKESLIGKLNNAIEKVYPQLQDKTITPTTEEQKIKADNGIYGLNEVTINPVTSIVDENIKPENIKSGASILGVEGNVVELVGEEITIAPKSVEQEFVPTAPSNGFTKVKVGAQTGVDINDYFENTITSQNSNNFAKQYLVKKIPQIYVDSSVTTLYSAFAGVNFITELKLLGDTSNVKDCSSMFSQAHYLIKLELFDTQNVKNMSNMFYYSNRLEKIPHFNTQNVTNMSSMLSNASEFQVLPQFNTQNVTNMSSMLSNANKLTTVPKLIANKVTNVGSMFSGTKSYFTDFGGLENLGMAYSISFRENYSSYTLDLSKCIVLTEQSLINALTNLYDIATKGCKVQQCVLGSENIVKLSSEEGQEALIQAQNYGWTIS